MNNAICHMINDDRIYVLATGACLTMAFMIYLSVSQHEDMMHILMNIAMGVSWYTIFTCIAIYCGAHGTIEYYRPVKNTEYLLLTAVCLALFPITLVVNSKYNN